MKKILFLIPTLSHGGAEHVLVNLVNNLDKTKYDITVQTLFDEGINKQYLSPRIEYKSWLKHQFRGNTFLFSLLPSKFLYHLIVKSRYDIVISYLEGPATRVLCGCPYQETRKVYWVHIEMGTKDKFKVGFLRFKQALKAYSDADKVVFVAKSVKKCFERISETIFSNGAVLYNVNETDKILEKSHEKVEDIHFSTEMINICSVAKIIPSKGYDRLVRVHKRLIEEGILHHIYILGIGEQRKELERFLKENGLCDTFTFVGFRSNPYKYVASCDLYVCSSRCEGFSTAVTEALIVGTPVVSTDCSGATELLGEHNEYGIVTDNSEDGIYQGMKKMLLDAKLRTYYARKALERGQKFSRESTVKAVEKMLDSL